MQPDGVKPSATPRSWTSNYRFVTTGIRCLGFVRADSKIPDLTSLRWNFRHDQIRHLIQIKGWLRAGK